MNLKRTMSQALHASKLTGEAAAFVAAGAAGATVSSAPAPGRLVRSAPMSAVPS